MCAADDYAELKQHNERLDTTWTTAVTALCSHANSGTISTPTLMISNA